MSLLEDTIINKIDIKIGKLGEKYLNLTTNQGRINCFKKELFSRLENLKNIRLDIDITEKNGFINLNDIIKVKEEIITEKVINEPKAEYTPRDNKASLMIISYVKDLTIGGVVGIEEFEKTCNKLMEIKNKLDKQ